MNFEAKTYSTIDYFQIPLRIAPIQTMTILLLTVAIALIPSFTIIATAKFIDAALAAFSSQSFSIIYRPLVFLTFLLLFSRLSTLIYTILKQQLGYRLRATIDPQIVRKRAALSYPHIENDETWDLTARIGKEPSERIGGAFYNLLDAAQFVIRVGGILAVLMVQAWWIGLLAVVVAIPLLKLSSSLGREDYLAYAAAQQPMRVADDLRGVLSSRADLEERALFGYGDAINERWYKAREQARQIEWAADRRNFIRTKSASLLTSLLSLAIGLLLLIPLTKGSLTAGMYIGLLTATWNLVEQMAWQLSSVFQQVAKNRAFLDDWTTFMQLDEALGAEARPDFSVHRTSFKMADILFEHVHFTYPGTDKAVLKDFSLTLSPGKRYAIVGRNGAGKSTLIKLLTGLYTQYEGCIRIGGRELSSFSPAELKGLFAVTFQDYANYEVSLRAQTTLGTAYFDADAPPLSNTTGLATDAAVRQALDQVGLGDLPESLSLGLDTPLGKLEAGAAELSGGQWQRIALARNALSDAPIHILDEPTAALDPVGEHQLYELFAGIGMSKGSMIIQITHRLGAAVSADEIIVIDEGQVAQCGTHDELIQMGGLYTEMYEAQRSWYVANQEVQEA